MKTDAVLTMNEYFATCCAKHVNPPADNARHVPITDESNIRSEEHGSRCDRWGHPCPDSLQDCLEKRRPRLCAAADELLL
jgi:hypothetical protein